MYSAKAIFISLLLPLLPFCAFSQQNGSQNVKKTTPKPATSSKNNAAPKAKSNLPTKASTDKSKKTAAKPAPPELQKLFDEVVKDQQQKSESTLIYEIDGLLIDETLTKTGHDFYDIFYSSWEAPEQVTNYTVRIIERPLRGRGFQIIVSVNDVEIIEENLQPRYDMLEAAGLNAVETTRGYLLNYENLKNQIESDDQQGTGMF